MFNLNDQERKQYALDFDLKRRKFEARTESLFKDALNAQLDQIDIDYTNSYETPSHELKKGMQEAFRDTYFKVGGYFYEETLKQLKSSFTNYQVKQESVWDEFIDIWLTQNAGERITNISQTSLDIIRRKLGEYQQQGFGIDKAARELRKEFSEFSVWRSKMIARTEIVSASNLASFEGAKTINLPMTKTWAAFIDSNTRATHVQADGTTIPKSDKFAVGFDRMDHPGDITASAGEIINCRCTLTFEVIA